MGNDFFNCYEPINEDIEVLKSDKKMNLKNNLNDFIHSIKSLSGCGTTHKILKIKFSKSLIIENRKNIIYPHFLVVILY